MKASTTSHHLCRALGFRGKDGLGEWGIGREGVSVRKGARVGWIEETERDTKGCGLKEVSGSNHVVFLPLTT